MAKPDNSLSDIAIHKFTQSDGLRGPHTISRSRQVQHQFHRIFSPKAGNRIVVAESQLEADAIVLAESRQDVVGLCEQPMRINGPLEKRPYYTFDLGITCVDTGEELIEVKPENQLSLDIDGELYPAYWDAIRSWCEANGFRCSVLTDKDISNNRVLVKNWRLLLGFVKRAIDDPNQELETDILDVIKHHPNISINQLIDHTVNRSDETITSCVAKLLHKHQLNARLAEKIFTRHTGLEVAR